MRPITIYLRPETWEAIVALGDDAGMKGSHLIREIVEDFVEYPLDAKTEAKAA